MDTKTVFYILGSALAVSAVGVAALGLRSPSFPGSRALLAGVTAYFVLLVAATTTFGVIQANDNPEEREHNAEAVVRVHEAEASLATSPAEEAPATPAETTTTSTTQAPAPGKETTLKLAADQAELAFDKTKLSAPAGAVSIDLTNPSAIPHDVVIARGNEVLGKSDLISNGDSATATADLEPGQYTYYCDVPGHEEAGMKGTLVVK